MTCVSVTLASNIRDLRPHISVTQNLQVGWGKDIPDILRNGDWNYAVFTVDKELRKGVNQRESPASILNVAIRKAVP